MYSVLGRLLLIFIIVFSSCKRRVDHYSRIILKADKIQIKKNENFDTTITVSTSLLNSFTDIFKNYEGNCSCEVKDEIIFLKGGAEIFKVGITKQTKECAFLIVSEGNKRRCYRLNYRIGMMMSELN